nr:hypothetical protein [Miniphocaeibacter massiliensis]
MEIYGYENTEEALEDGRFMHYDFYISYYEYINNSIYDNINSDNALIRLFTIFDRRIGKKKFKELKNILVGETKWLEEFYNFRYYNE